MPQTFVYLRVSKVDQDLEKNKADILKLSDDLHLGHVQFIEEKVSGRIFWRKRQSPPSWSRRRRAIRSSSANCLVWAAVCWSAWRSCLWQWRRVFESMPSKGIGSSTTASRARSWR